jgi:hypothetical protein
MTHMTSNEKRALEERVRALSDEQLARFLRNGRISPQENLKAPVHQIHNRPRPVQQAARA